MITPPSYDSLGLVNLVAEIESRLTGSAPSPTLGNGLGSSIPEAATIVVLLFDGLGMAQIAHEAGQPFRDSVRGTIQAGFPTTTSSSLATIATGLAPGGHGVIAHLAWLPEHQKVVNTLKWVDLTGAPVDHDYPAVLPGPNLWERLRASGVEPVTVQPAEFQNTPLTRVLYRGARFEGAWGVEDFIDATVQLAGEPNRLVFGYVPQVDFAGHVFGLDTPEFVEAMGVAARVWREVSRRLPRGAALIGTADHGLVEYEESQKLLIRESRFDGLRFAGDPRGVHLWCDEADATDLAAMSGGTLLDPVRLFGPDPSPTARERMGLALLLPPQGVALLPRGFDKRLRAYHGGLDPAEVDIPLLIA